MLKRLYNWVLSWADTKYGTPALASVSFVESSFFPLPPDPFLMALCLGKPRKSFWYAFICSVSSVLGGLAGYLIGWALWEIVGDFFLTNVFGQEAFSYVSKRYEENAFLAILGAAFTPIPYKVFTVTAGVFQINVLTLIIASSIGRSARFFLEAGLIFFFGEKVKSFIDRYFNTIASLFFTALVFGFVIVKLVFKN